MGFQRQSAQRTLRYVLAYRLLFALRRGWRFNNPNLDQLGLLQVSYSMLDEFCSDETSLTQPTLTCAHYLPITESSFVFSFLTKCAAISVSKVCIWMLSNKTKPKPLPTASSVNVGLSTVMSGWRLLAIC